MLWKRHVRSTPTQNCLKTAIERQEHCGNRTPMAPGVLHNATYICYVQMWQVLLVIFSYAAFTCNIILVLTLIVFFIRYRKTMQAMLMAFITTNMNNSGIPSTKANPISRTFPPLFTIKISEEE